MIILTQFLVEYSLVIPILKFNQSEFQFSIFNFCLLVLSTVLIAAGGYIINDYADVEIDRINKPERMVIGKFISPKKAINLYSVFTVLGISIALYLAFEVQLYELVYIHVIVSGLLYFYAFNYKRQLLFGNIIVALLSATTVMLPSIYEAIAEVKQLSVSYIYFDIVFIYAGFAFVTTLIREIIKDAEDIEGDQLAECKTLPIVIGATATKIVLLTLLMATFSSIAYFQYQLYTLNLDRLSQIYIILFIQLPILFLIYKLSRAKEKKDYSFASLLIKIIMLFGMLSMPVLFVRAYNG